MSEPKWIRFVEVPVQGRKTRYWYVQTKDGKGHLGTVEWYGPWRKYVFAPAGYMDLVFEERCLRDIAEFVETQTREHREAVRARKVVSA